MLIALVFTTQTFIFVKVIRKPKPSEVSSLTEDTLTSGYDTMFINGQNMFTHDAKLKNITNFVFNSIKENTKFFNWQMTASPNINVGGIQ